MEHGIVDVFSQKSGYTAALGDLVLLSGDQEVAKASRGALFPLGRVTTKADGVINNGKLSIRTKYASLYNRPAGENLQAGPVVLGADGQYYQWSPLVSDGVQTITFATNAAGDGLHTMVIDGATVTYIAGAAATPTVVATAVVALINSNIELISKGFKATNSAGIVTLTSQGKSNDGAAIVVSTTDSNQSVVKGGLVSGVGYSESSVIGLCIKSTLSGADAPVLVEE